MILSYLLAKLKTNALAVAEWLLVLDTPRTRLNAYWLDRFTATEI